MKKHWRVKSEIHNSINKIHKTWKETRLHWSKISLCFDSFTSRSFATSIANEFTFIWWKNEFLISIQFTTTGKMSPHYFSTLFERSLSNSPAKSINVRAAAQQPTFQHVCFFHIDLEFRIDTLPAIWKNGFSISIHCTFTTKMSHPFLECIFIVRSEDKRWIMEQWRSTDEAKPKSSNLATKIH